MQKLLASQGYYDGEVNGKIGPVTRSAISSAEKRFRMKPTGRPGQRIYRALSASQP